MTVESGWSTCHLPPGTWPGCILWYLGQMSLGPTAFSSQFGGVIFQIPIVYFCMKLDELYLQTCLNSIRLKLFVIVVICLAIQSIQLLD